MIRAFPNLTDHRFNELIVRYSAFQYEASEAERLALAYEENAWEAEGGLTGKSGSLAELRDRDVEAATVAGHAAREAGEARERRRIALDGAGNAVGALREEGMPEGEWVRHGNAGVYLWSRSPERAGHDGVAFRPWEAVERAPARVTPNEVSEMLRLEEAMKARARFRAGAATEALAVGAWLVAHSLDSAPGDPSGRAAVTMVLAGITFMVTFFGGLFGPVVLALLGRDLAEARAALAALHGRAPARGAPAEACGGGG